MRKQTAVLANEERNIVRLDQGPVRRGHLETVGVLETAHERRLVALKALSPGDVVLELNGSVNGIPSRYSVQVGWETHLHSDLQAGDRELVERYAWRYMNHHCEPNSVIRDRTVVAIRDIAVGDDITFDYNTTEYDMASPFACHCGSPVCVGLVRGARHLTEEQRQRVARWLPDYLR